MPQAQAFAALTASLETGANFWDGGLFYGTPELNSLHLVRDYFKEHPNAATKAVLSIKGCLTSQETPDGSPEFVRKSVEECISILPGNVKKIDIWQRAKVDPNVPIGDHNDRIKESGGQR